MESGWIMWVAVLVAWTLVGMVVAYIFGGIARRTEVSEDATAAPEVVSYMRRHKRASRPPHPSTQLKVRRVAGGRARH